MLQLPPHVLEFMKTFTDKGYTIYAVGGCVRDLLLGTVSKDWDFTSNATPEQVLELFEDAYYNNSFGTVGIPVELDGIKHIYEVTPFRKEDTYTNFRHPDKIEWTDNVEDDLARRDFTVNAMAFNGTELTDPFGGQADLEKRIIRAVGDPDKRFNEDALRLMRAVRFTAQLNFSLDSETHESMKRNAHLIQNIAKERIQDELFKLLKTDQPAEGIMAMRETGLLKEILPEVDVCFEIPQVSPNRHHKHDVGTHLVLSLKHTPSKDPVTRFATLLHDIGKAPTFRKDEATGQITFYNHEVAGAHMAEKIADRLKFSKKDKEKLVTLVANHQFTVSELQTDKAVRRFIRSIGKELIQDMLDLRVGDRIGSDAKPTSWRFELFKKRLEEVQHEPFAIKDLKVDGHDVMTIFNIAPSRQIGDVLEKIFTMVTEEGVPNEREILLQKLEELRPQ